MLNTGGAVLLEKWRPLTAGPLRSLSVEFCADSAVRVQLWRPSESTVDAFTLVWDKLVRPSTLAARTVVNLTKTEQILVESNFRLGLQADVGGNSVPVSMSFSRANLVFSAQALPSVARCVRANFDHLQYPYKFDVDLCGELGEFVLSPVVCVCVCVCVCVFTCRFKLNNRMTVLLEKWRHLATGPLRSLSVEFCADSAVRVQLWRPSESTVDAFTLVWNKLVRPSTLAARTIINLTSTEYFLVEENDVLGVQAVAIEQGIPVQKSFYHGNIVTSLQSASVTRCETRKFDRLAHPYQFNIDLCSELGWFCLNSCV
ncbi:hypothetical protein NP493_88g05024 [Ridgeia piscesae]|uniref:Uncharacterized protein n=1 Tax=Ridgeia piscesae TaxID=27915 RepID=A0AAD9P8G9_RIDPI|nr:hypothetical protein NP493_88g05024 [Ridgeia piscesae]